MGYKANNKISSPFYPVTEADAREWYEMKYINTTAYLLIIKRLLTPQETDLVIPNVLEFCEKWKISKSAFYRAVNTLHKDNYFDWEATQGIILKRHEPVISVSSEEKCPTDGIVSHERDGESHERDVSHERDGESHERDRHLYICSDLTDQDRSKSDLFPPTPQRGEEKEEAVLVEAELIEEEVVQTLDREERKQSSQEFQISELVHNATQRCEDRMRNAGKSRNYRTGYGAKDIDPEFLNWFRVRVMSKWTDYENETPQEEDARQWIRNRENKGMYDIVEDRYEQMLREKADPEKAQLLRTQNIFRSVNKESERRRKVETGIEILDGLE